MTKPLLIAVLALIALPAFADIWDCGESSGGTRFTNIQAETQGRDCTRLDVALPEFPTRQEIAQFQRQLKVGDRSQVGLVVKIRVPVVKVQPPRGLERWYRIDELEPLPRPARALK